MKKTFCAILFIISLSNNAFSNHLNSQWGIVVSIKSIYHNQIVNVPTSEKTCKYVKQQHPRLENIIVGGLIGSVIGNKISDNHGAGTMGAIFGSLVAIDQNQNYKSCEYLTTYNTENRKIFSHYKIRVRTKWGYRTINSKTHHSIHDVIYLN